VQGGNELHEELGEFFAADEHDASAARNRWADQLTQYVNKQGSLDAIRLRPASEPPWPADENPMFSYLLERGSEIATEADLETALRWIARNAWLEGCIAERNRVLRALEEA
jgi:hypothetical protein